MHYIKLTPWKYILLNEVSKKQIKSENIGFNIHHRVIEYTNYSRKNNISVGVHFVSDIFDSVIGIFKTFDFLFKRHWVIISRLVSSTKSIRCYCVRFQVVAGKWNFMLLNSYWLWNILVLFWRVAKELTSMRDSCSNTPYIYMTMAILFFILLYVSNMVVDICIGRCFSFNILGG